MAAQEDLLSAPNDKVLSGLTWNISGDDHHDTQSIEQVIESPCAEASSLFVYAVIVVECWAKPGI